MEIKNHFFTNNRFKRRLFISYIFILLFPIVVMGLSCYWWMSNILTEQVMKFHEVAIKEVRDYIDKRFMELNNFSIQLSQTPWVYKIMYMQGDKIDSSRINNFEITDHVSELKGYDALNDFIDTVILFSPEKNLIVSSIGITDGEVFFDELYKLEKLDFNNWNKLLADLKTPKVLNPSILNKKMSLNEKVITCLYPLPNLEQECRGFFITYIKHSAIIKMLEDLKIIKDSSIYIFDNAGNEISCVNPSNVYFSLQEDGFQINKNSSSILKISKEKYFVFNYVSNVNDWQYLVTVPYNTAMAKVEVIKNIAILAAVVLALIGLFICYGLTLKNYNPLLKLINMLKGHTPKGDILNVNEFDYLNNVVTSIIKEKSLLKLQSEKQKPIIKNNCLLKLLNGSLSEEEMSIETLKTLGVNFPFQFYMVSLFVLSDIKSINSDIQINRITENINNKGVSSYIIEIDGYRKAVISNFNDINGISNYILNIKKHLELAFKIKCTTGVGKPYDSIDNIKLSYNESIIAANYRLIKFNSDIIFHENIENRKSAFYYYPTDKEVQLLNALKTANYDCATNIVREIIDKNISDSFLNIIAARCLFYDLIGTGFKVLNDLELADYININPNKIETLETLKEMELYLDSIFKKICDYIEQNKRSSNNLLLVNIENYIDENYCRNDMSLESLADAMGVSVSYLCKFFKEQFGYNFLDYLNRKRIRKAKELLNGNMTIIQIAQEVGYNNDVTFRRLFKKYEGVTPGKILDSNLYRY